ncbi:MAG: murein L,D-transpeptidase, partial [Isosphaeraceae bacterium]|nr:murein L,D-transpeptidase [Isosphaeraceae bacterium]
MKRAARRIGAELVPVILVLASLGGSLALVLAVHRRQVAGRAPRGVVVAPKPTLPVPVAPPPAPA